MEVKADRPLKVQSQPNTERVRGRVTFKQVLETKFLAYKLATLQTLHSPRSSSSTKAYFIPQCGWD